MHHSISDAQLIGMAGRTKIGSRLSLVLDDETRAAVESAVAESGEPTAAVLRKAIRAGLRLSGGQPRSVQLDEAQWKDVQSICKWYDVKPESIVREILPQNLWHLVERLASERNMFTPDGMGVLPKEADEWLASQPHPFGESGGHRHSIAFQWRARQVALLRAQLANRPESVNVRREMEAVDQRLNKLGEWDTGETEYAIRMLEREKAKLLKARSSTPAGGNTWGEQADAELGFAPKRNKPRSK